jgi:S-DNA-T family DNA segregation ATPase FtsK/SpoIIIE
MFDPVYAGIDENRGPVYLDLVAHNLLVGGEPGSGKSVFLQNIVAHACLSADSRPVLIDPQYVELGMWETSAEAFIGPDIRDAINVMRWLHGEAERRTNIMRRYDLRKLTREHDVDVIPIVIEELAYFTTMVGTKEQREEFTTLVRGAVAMFRKVAMPVVMAAQRPTADIVPTSLRDITGYRAAFRCTTPVSSNVILGDHWAQQGYSAADIAPEDAGIGWIIAGEPKITPGKGRFTRRKSSSLLPRRFRAAYLTDEDITYLVDQAAYIRRPHTITTSTIGGDGTDVGINGSQVTA